MPDVPQEANLISRAAALAQPFEDAVHQLVSLPGVLSVHNLGLAAGIELAVIDGQPGRLGVLVQAGVFDQGLLTRAPSDALVLAPPFVCTTDNIRDMVDPLASAIQALARSPQATA
jgi:beta-alanine--pyruvate transaminase